MLGDRITKAAAAGGVQLPVNLAMAKAHLSITEDYDDSLIAAALHSATEWAEEVTNRAIVQRDYLIVRDRFPKSEWCLPLGKISAVVSIEYLDSDGALQTWTASPLPYESDLSSDFQSRVRPKNGSSWPTIGERMGSARLTVTAGWSQDDVPYTVREAILLKVGSIYGTRMPGDEDPEMIELAARTMLSAWKQPTW